MTSRASLPRRPRRGRGRRGRVASLVLAVALGTVACTAPGRSPRTRPNIVLVLADDLGLGDVGPYGASTHVPTPALDRLAGEGMRFDDVHSPSAVCTPTRYGVLCGRYAWRTRLRSGVLTGGSPALIEPGRETIATLLRRSGYRTAGFGKWHLGLGDEPETDYGAPLRPGPLEAGFERYLGIPASLDFPPYVWIDDAGVETPATLHVPHSEPRRRGGRGFWRAGPAAPDFDFAAVLPRIADEASAWLHTVADAPEPFFLYVPLSAPHTPWLPSASFRRASSAGAYGDFVAQVDASIGRILATLAELELAEDRLVVVTSDNGAHWTDEDIATFGHDANAGLRGQKADIFEGGHRVPFLVRWPGRVPAGTTSAHLGSLTDLFRTFATLAGVTVPEGVAEDSIDQSAVWLGRTDRPARTSVVHHSLDGMFAFRAGRWKLILGRGSGGFTAPRRIEVADGEPAGQLYDLARDPFETRDLYRERPAVVERLTAALEAVRSP